MYYTQALTLPTLPIDGDDITADSVINITHNPNGIKDITAKVANSLRTEVNTTTYTIQPNQDVFNYVTNNTGNVTLNLPPAITQYKDITIKKNVNNAFTVTLQRAGSDTIENPSNPLTTPTATSITPIVSCGQSITLTPVGSVWWIKDIDLPNVHVRAALVAGNQSVTGGTNATIIFDNDSTGLNYDKSGSYNNANGEFIAPISGVYRTYSCLYANNNGVAGDYYMRIKYNGVSSLQKIYPNNISNSYWQIDGQAEVYLTAGQKIITEFNPQTTKVVAAGSEATFTNIDFISF